jgi:hypothetical protein
MTAVAEADVDDHFQCALQQSTAVEVARLLEAVSVKSCSVMSEYDYASDSQCSDEFKIVIYLGFKLLHEVSID